MGRKIFSASQAEKFMHCHASANLETAIPGYEDPIEDPNADNAANRGTKMHELFAKVLSLPLSDATFLTVAMAYVLQVKAQRRFKQLVEITETADWLPSGARTTPDLVLYLKDELHVFDLKTGKIPVSAQDNYQLKFYAATFLKYAPDAKQVNLHIVQPWANNIDVDVVSVQDLMLWMEEAVAHDDAITHGDVTFQPGDHCTFCPANPHSRAARGYPYCPVMLALLYPPKPLNDAALLAMADEED